MTGRHPATAARRDATVGRNPGRETPGDRIAGRYRVEGVLAHGPASVVYHATDEATGEPVALKLLRPDLRQDEHARSLFAREYRVLAQLQHPRIVRVYGFGISAVGPYYTMERLGDGDLHERVPLPWREACRLLRDVAGTLALLHTRQLVHGDPSPHNVRLTPDGRAKLLDFSALTSFGATPDPDPELAPPRLPPEAARGEPLNAQSDLYGLGRLAYWLLTGQQVAPAREVIDRPSRYAPDLPAELDALVMSLLDHTPARRPSSAADVIEQLGTMAGLDPEATAEGWQSYLSHPRLVGRDRELQRLRSHFGRALRGDGNAVLIEGKAGTGLSRLLAEAEIEAELQGATMVHVDAEDHPGPYGVAHAIVTELLHTLPEAALNVASPHAPVLGHLFPQLRAGLAELPPLPRDPGEQRARMQATLGAWVADICRSHPLALCVDDVQAADESSLALLAGLPRRSEHLRLVVIATLRRTDRAASPEGVAVLRRSCHRMRLRSLEAQSMHDLVRSLFGAVGHVDALAAWLQQHTGGVPMHAIGLLRWLVGQGRIRYVQGGWVLPEVFDDGLPTSFDDLLETRVRNLSPEARRAAARIAVQQRPFDRETLGAAAEQDDPQLERIVDELLATEILVTSGGHLRFRHEMLRRMLQRTLDVHEQCAVHRCLGRHALRRAGEEDHFRRLEAGWHLLMGGDESKGADLLACSGGVLWRGVQGMTTAASAFEAAIEVYEREGRPPHELAAMRTALAVGAWYVDRRLMEHGDRAVDLMLRLTGLERARRLRPRVGKKLALGAGVGSAAMAHVFKRRYITTERRSFREIFLFLFGSAASRIGVATAYQDPEAIERTMEKLEPLTYFGRGHIASIMHRYFEHLMYTAQGRETEALALGKQVHAELSDPKWIDQLDEDGYQGLLAGLTLSLGVVETMRDMGTGLAYARQLEDMDLAFYRGAANQLRMLHHAYRGEEGQTQKYREAIETVAVQAGSTWQADIFIVAGLHHIYQATGDVVGLKRTQQHLERWAEEAPSLRVHADLCQAAHALESGNAKQALPLLESIVERMPPRRKAGWSDARACYARALLECDRLEEAERVCRATVEATPPGDRDFPTMHLEAERVLALVEARMGRREEAIQRLDDLLLEHASRGPVTVGNLHHARALLALEHRDAIALEYHAKVMTDLFRGTANPALLTRADRLMARAEEVLQVRLRPSSPHLRTETPTVPPPSYAGHTTNRVRSALDACRAAEERARRALELIVEHTGATGGHFFAVKRGELSLLAQLQTDDPTPGLLDELLALTRSFLDDQEEKTATLNQSVIPGIDDAPPANRLVLHTHHDDSPVVVAAVALCGSASIKPVPLDMIDAIARSFYDAGDLPSLLQRQ